MPAEVMPLYLASRSPRRRLLLDEAGLRHTPIVGVVDDSTLRRGRVSARAWVMALAYLKARAAEQSLRTMNRPRGIILAADTVCVLGDELFGQPRDAHHARTMLQTMRCAVHETMSGVCLLRYMPTVDRFDAAGATLFVDAARVHLGEIDDAMIEAYIRSGDWRGKAGGYNLSERIDAGWPIRCEGDPATVMGLPMRRLSKIVHRLRNSMDDRALR